MSAGDCFPGQQYSNTTQTCEECPIGYYNDDLDPARHTCIMCHADYVTTGTGATSDRDCSIRESVVYAKLINNFYIYCIYIYISFNFPTLGVTV